MTWPYPDRPPIEVIRWKPEAEPGLSRDKVPATQVRTRPGGETTIDPNNAPDHRSDVTSFAVPGVVWVALPKPSPVEIKFRPDADRQVIAGETLRSDEASFGVKTGATGVAAGSAKQVPNGDLTGDPCPRFAAVAAMLAEQKRLNAIADFVLVSAQADHRAAKRGDLAVWRLGPKGDVVPAWFWMDEARGVRRTLLVYKVTLVSGQLVYWLDLEPRNDRDIYATLLVAPIEHWETAAIGLLVERIETDKRVTRVAVDPEWSQHARMRRWFHHRANHPLDGGRAVKDMAALVASA